MYHLQNEVCVQVQCSAPGCLLSVISTRLCWSQSPPSSCLTFHHTVDQYSIKGWILISHNLSLETPASPAQSWELWCDQLSAAAVLSHHPAQAAGLSRNLGCHSTQQLASCSSCSSCESWSAAGVDWMAEIRHGDSRLSRPWPPSSCSSGEYRACSTAALQQHAPAAHQAHGWRWFRTGPSVDRHCWHCTQ